MSRYIISLCLVLLLAGFIFLLSSLGVGQPTNTATTPSDTLAVELLDQLEPDGSFAEKPLARDGTEALPTPSPHKPSVPKAVPGEPPVEPDLP
ncbi:hypothetical protein [Parvularcula sp. IMCC14364]|uniref:hypothetical protein n=1 Tax=Parvularcula sp. IMCC14364 TaxID=3067902 RepID=UPI0027416B06|nr:hypothetical protein [Parvularcula sp. IMCC14364]